MSMYEPDDAEWMQAGDESPEQAMWMPPGDNSPPFWGAPARPPLGIRPPVGQVPGRPVWPFWGYWGYRLRNAQRDIKYLAEVVDDIILDRIDKGILAPGPNAVQTPGVTPPLPTRPTPLLGVTDGSDAATGIVGEFLLGETVTNWSIASGVSGQTQNVSALVVPPGDWDLMAELFVEMFVNNGYFQLKPAPAGLTPNELLGTLAIGAEYGGHAISGRARLNVSVPTLLPFTIGLSNLSAATVAGTATLTVTARRMR